jgi:hypothetical protein
MHTERKITVHSHELSFTTYPSPSPYSQTDRMTDRDQIHSLRVGWRNIFPVVLLCQFLVVAEIVLGDTYLPYQLCRCVFFLVAAGNSFWLHRLVFWLWREKGLGVTSLLTIPVVPLCQFFGCAGK